MENKRLLALVLLISCIGFSNIALAQATWKVHDLNRPKPEVVTPADQVLPVPAPPDATVLFDGSDLSGWEAVDGSPTKWIIRDGNMESVAGAGYIKSKAAFGDMQLHVEWAAPLPVKGTGQGRGNSGVFLMGKYEVQVLDSYQNDTYADGQASAIYGQYPPLVNASRPPGEWQTYDIYFRRPRFGKAGQVLSPARVTVIHNGILTQDNVEIWGGTEWLQYAPYKAHADRLPIRFQDHGNPVLFRNVWVRDLEKGDDTKTTMEREIAMEPAMLDKYVGRYETSPGNYQRIVREGDKLFAVISLDRPMEIQPRSKEVFVMKHTAGEFTFDFDAAGNPTGYTWRMGGGTTQAKKVD